MKIIKKLSLYLSIFLVGVYSGTIYKGIEYLNQKAIPFRKSLEKYINGDFPRGTIVRHIKSGKYGVVSSYGCNSVLGKRIYVDIIETDRVDFRRFYDFELETVDPETTPSLKSIYLGE